MSLTLAATYADRLIREIDGIKRDACRVEAEIAEAPESARNRRLEKTQKLDLMILSEIVDSAIVRLYKRQDRAEAEEEKGEAVIEQTEQTTEAEPEPQLIDLHPNASTEAVQNWCCDDPDCLGKMFDDRSRSEYFSTQNHRDHTFIPTRYDAFPAERNNIQRQLYPGIIGQGSLQATLDQS